MSWPANAGHPVGFCILKPSSRRVLSSMRRHLGGPHSRAMTSMIERPVDLCRDRRGCGWPSARSRRARCTIARSRAAAHASAPARRRWRWRACSRCRACASCRMRWKGIGLRRRRSTPARRRRWIAVAWPPLISAALRTQREQLAPARRRSSPSQREAASARGLGQVGRDQRRRAGTASLISVSTALSSSKRAAAGRDHHRIEHEGNVRAPFASASATALTISAEPSMPILIASAPISVEARLDLLAHDVGRHQDGRRATPRRVLHRHRRDRGHAHRRRAPAPS